MSIEVKDETRNNGAPRDFFQENFGVHVERGVDVERGVLAWSSEGMRGVPSLNTFRRPWGKLIREGEDRERLQSRMRLLYISPADLAL
jgi:hypothetical protein